MTSKKYFNLNFAEEDRGGLSSVIPRRKYPQEARKRGNKAFTLAEVLITLVIIGVIGALTVPSLIQNTKKQEYVTALKKTYSTLSQVSQMIIQEEGTPKCDDGGWACSNDNVYTLFKKYLNNAKECAGETGCLNQGKYKQLDGSIFGDDWNLRTDYRMLILADGTQLMFWGANSSCSNSTGGTNGYCAVVYADINGEKKPNTVGRDLFTFMLKEKGIYPAGCDSTEDYCLVKGEPGRGCACKVLREDAMNY